ncbi:MAG: fasciclin domain-containing protein [Cyanobacteria bacterium P01_D01_bin.1]
MRFSKFTLPFNRLAGVAAALMILPIAVACDQPADETAEAPGDMTEEPMADSGTIVDVAVNSGSFDTLVAAVQAAGLEGALSNEGPYTVFAPTDEAFAALEASNPGTLDMLLSPGNEGVLTEILAYHVVSGAVTSDQIETGTVSTIGDGALSLVADGTGVMVNDANVISADILTSNGVIHAIDTVLLPPSAAEEPTDTTPEAMPEEMPGEMPEAMPEEMPEETP